MKLIKVARTRWSPASTAKGIIEGALNKLTEFAIRKIIELKLAPSTFSFPMDLRNTSRTCTKTLDKISMMLRRAFLKANPYIAMTKEEMTPRTTRALTLVMYSQYRVSQNPFRSSNVTYGLGEPDMTRESKRMSRYADYLNFLCLKYKVPVRFIEKSTMSIHPVDLRRLEKMSEAERALESNRPRYRVATELIMQVGYWRPNTREFIHSGKTTVEWIGEELKTKTESAVFNPNIWKFTVASNYVFGSSVLPTTPGKEDPYFSFERVYLYLPYALKIMKTISRTTTYATEAFSIGSP